MLVFGRYERFGITAAAAEMRVHVPSSSSSSGSNGGFLPLRRWAHGLHDQLVVWIDVDRLTGRRAAGPGDSTSTATVRPT